MVFRRINDNFDAQSNEAAKRDAFVAEFTICFTFYAQQFKTTTNCTLFRIDKNNRRNLGTNFILMNRGHFSFQRELATKLKVPNRLLSTFVIWVLSEFHLREKGWNNCYSMAIVCAAVDLKVELVHRENTYRSARRHAHALFHDWKDWSCRLFIAHEYFFFRCTPFLAFFLCFRRSLCVAASCSPIDLDPDTFPSASSSLSLSLCLVPFFSVFAQCALPFFFESIYHWLQVTVCYKYTLIQL